MGILVKTLKSAVLSFCTIWLKETRCATKVLRQYFVSVLDGYKKWS